MPTAVAPWPASQADTCRAAAEIGDGCTLAGLLDEAGEEGPVERLICELVAEAVRVLLGDSVVAAAGAVVTPGTGHGQQRRTAPAGSGKSPDQASRAGVSDMCVLARDTRQFLYRGFLLN